MEKDRFRRLRDDMSLMQLVTELTPHHPAICHAGWPHKSPLTAHHFNHLAGDLGSSTYSYFRTAEVSFITLPSKGLQLIMNDVHGSIRRSARSRGIVVFPNAYGGRANDRLRPDSLIV